MLHNVIIIKSNIYLELQSVQFTSVSAVNTFSSPPIHFSKYCCNVKNLVNLNETECNSYKLA